MKHIMVDIETLAVCADAVVTEIGACVFDETGVLDTRTFHEFLSPAIQINDGRKVDEGTMRFRAAETAVTLLESMINGNIATITLNDFSTWAMDILIEVESFIWCNGTDFDAATLKHIYKQYGVKAPWKYNQFRDLRTLRTIADMLGIKVEKRKNDHNALNDALNQAAEAAEIMAEINEVYYDACHEGVHS